MSETIFYNDSGVNITNTRAILGGKTYAMSNITSVSMIKKKVNYVFVVILALVGLFSLSLIGQNAFVAIVLLLICAGLIYLLVRPAYGVTLGSASGEAEALVSRDRARIEQIVNAMNQAIVHRG